VNLAPPSNCAEAQRRKATLTKGDVIRGIRNNPTVTEKVGVGTLCEIPVFGAVSCGVAGFLSRLPAYLKIAGGGIVMFGGLALVIAGATGNTSTLSRGAAGVVMRTPVGATVERRRAVRREVTSRRASGAAEEARSRVVTDAGGKVRVTSRAAGNEARRADDEYRGTKGSRDRDRLAVLRSQRRSRAS
jgi:hypothetical protein